MTKVVVVGSLNMDLVVTVAAHPRIGETVFGQSLRYFPGGKGANQAIAARRLGAAVELVGRVGADAFGETLTALQRAEGVDTKHLHAVEGTPTGTALIAVAADATNTIIVNAGANAALRASEIDAVTFAADDILLVQLETPFDVVRAALTKARQAGALSILNPSPVSACDASLLPLSDLVVLNEIELAVLSERDLALDSETAIAEAAARLIEQGCGSVVVTLGAAGALVCVGGTTARIGGRAVAALDTTGAGDCFTGALAASLLFGSALAEAVHFANAAASISVTREGASPSMPKLAEVEGVFRR